jgi:hypothetical protein
MPARAWQRDVLANFYTSWLIENEQQAMTTLMLYFIGLVLSK